MADISRRSLDDGPTPDINPDKVCHIIVKARELEAEDEGVASDDSDSPDDRFTSVLTDEAYDSIKQELVAFIDALDENEKCELVALVWVGRGDYSAAEWRNAVDEAHGRQETETSAYLLGMPLLAFYLEAGLAEFDISCRDFEAGS